MVTVRPRLRCCRGSCPWFPGRLRAVTDAPPPEDPRDELIREQAARLEAQAQQIAGQAERIAALEDRVEDHYPEGNCPCGLDLSDAKDLGVARSYQQQEIPATPAERVQHDLHTAQCACGRMHAARRPAGVPDSGLSIGPRLRPGGLPGRLPARAGEPAAPVAGFDETTLRSGPAGDKKYVHGAFTEEYSAFWLRARTLDSMEDAGILPGFAGIVVSDRYQNYFSSRWKHVAGTRRACLTCSGTTRTAPRATRAPSGPRRHSGRCAA
jgi:hypothetical protein